MRAVRQLAPAATGLPMSTGEGLAVPLYCPAARSRQFCCFQLVGVSFSLQCCAALPQQQPGRARAVARKKQLKGSAWHGVGSAVSCCEI